MNKILMDLKMKDSGRRTWSRDHVIKYLSILINIDGMCASQGIS